MKQRLLDPAVLVLSVRFIHSKGQHLKMGTVNELFFLEPKPEKVPTKHSLGALTTTFRDVSAATRTGNLELFADRTCLCNIVTGQDDLFFSSNSSKPYN